MANSTECQTHDAIYSIKIEPTMVGVEIELPFDLTLSDEEKEVLKANLHNVMELVMSKYFHPQS